MKRLHLSGRCGGDADVLAGGLGTSGRISFRDERSADGDESGAGVTSAINRSLLASAARPPTLMGILVSESRPRSRRRRALSIVFCDQLEIIGVGGEPVSSEDEGDDGDDDDERAEPSEVLNPEDRAFLNLTKRNTDFNSISSNLSGASRTLVDWVDENDLTTERSALTGRHKKFTPLVNVAPFSTGRGPGPLKVNPVAPMQNGEVVPSERRRPEMVERPAAKLPERTGCPAERLTRLDQLTRLDDSPQSPDGEEAADTCGGTPPARTKASSEPTAATANPAGAGAMRCATGEGGERLLAMTGGVGEGKMEPSASRKLVGRTRNAAASVEDYETSSKKSQLERISNIDAIKSKLAEKAGAQNGSWSNHIKPQERSRARLNSLDGVSKTTKSRHCSESSDVASGDRNIRGAGRGRSPFAAFLEPAESSRAAAYDAASEKPDPAAVVDKTGESAVADTKQKRLHGGGDLTNVTSAEQNEVSAPGDFAVKPAFGNPKPPFPGEKPELATKPGKAEGSGHRTTVHNAGRRPGLGIGGADHVTVQAERLESPAKVHESQHAGNAAAYLDSSDKLAMAHSARLEEEQKSPASATKSLDDDKWVPEECFDVSSHKERPHSPMPCMQKEIDTKTQRAMKREKEIEKQRENIEKRNRQEKKAAERRGPTAEERSECGYPSGSQELRSLSCPADQAERVLRTTLSERESIAGEPDKSAPKPGDPATSWQDYSGSGVSALPSQPKVASGQRTPRESILPTKSRAEVIDSQAARASPAGQPADTVTKPAPSPRSSLITDDDDDDDDNDDDQPPLPPLRASSVSPRSRKRGLQAVSFAPSTEDSPRPAAAKPRSQSVPRPGQLDSSLMCDQQVLRRPGGGGGGGERRSRRDEPRPRGRFSLKKLLKFGRDEKRRDRDQVYGEFRAKPEIIHPMDRAGVGCVQVIGRPVEPPRRPDVGSTWHATTASRGLHQSSASRLERSSPVTQSAQTGLPPQQVASGLTPEGRPKPPPPPPPTSRQVTDPAGPRPPLSPPSRPPPPNPQLLSRSRDVWNRSAGQSDTNYANLGASRAGLMPKKPGRSQGVGPPAAARAAGATARPAPLGQAVDAPAPPTGHELSHHLPSRISWRKAASVVPASLEENYEAVTSGSLEALQQMVRLGPVPDALRAVQTAPLALCHFQVAAHSRLVVGPHVFVSARHGQVPVVLAVTRGVDAPPPLSVPPVAQFSDVVPARLVPDDGAGPHQSEVIGTVHVLPAARVVTLASLIANQPAVTSVHEEKAVYLLLLQAVHQLLELEARGQTAIDQSLEQLVALAADGEPPSQLAAVVSDCRPSRPLSVCLAALAAMLRLLGVMDAAERARDGRAVSSVPDLPSDTAFELLASLLQRDDTRSLRRAGAVLECLLWAPSALAPAEAERWLHRERAALLGSAAPAQPSTVAERLRLRFLVHTDIETVRDACELISI